MAWDDKLKARWGLQSGMQLWLVLLVFALTGTSVLFLKTPLLAWVGIGAEASTGFHTFLYLLLVLPLYQILLLIFAALLGQFSFFWEYEKRTVRRIRNLWNKDS